MWNRVLLIIMVVAIIGALGVLGYVIANYGAEGDSTEFYILNLEGRADDYPDEVRAGEDAEVIVGIVNHEGRTVTYRLEIEIEGLKNNEAGPLTLTDDEKWDEIVSFRPDKVGDNQKVEFLLYENGETEPYLEPLYLWIDVTD